MINTTRISISDDKVLKQVNNLSMALVSLYGVGGHTVPLMWANDLHGVQDLGEDLWPCYHFVFCGH